MSDPCLFFSSFYQYNKLKDYAVQLKKQLDSSQAFLPDKVAAAMPKDENGDDNFLANEILMKTQSEMLKAKEKADEAEKRLIVAERKVSTFAHEKNEAVAMLAKAKEEIKIAKEASGKAKADAAESKAAAAASKGEIEALKSTMKKAEAKADDMKVE